MPGARLVDAGYRVLLVDLDPHASLSHAFGVATDPPSRGSYELFTDATQMLSRLARTTPVERLSLCPAQPALATLERRGASQPGLGLALGRALHAARDTYDYALLDCPPTLGLLMVNALAAADRRCHDADRPAGAARPARHAAHRRHGGAFASAPAAARDYPDAARQAHALGQQSLDQLREIYGEHVSPDPIPSTPACAMPRRWHGADACEPRRRCLPRGAAVAPRSDFN